MLAAPIATIIHTFVAQAVGYFAGVGAVFLVVSRWGARTSVPIPGPRRVDNKQNRPEITHMIVTLAGAETAATILGRNPTGVAKLSNTRLSPCAALAWIAASLRFTPGRGST